MSFESDNNFALVHTIRKRTTSFSCSILFLISYLGTGLGMSKYDPVFLVPVFVHDATI